MSERDELAQCLAAAYGDLEVRTPDLNAADAILAAGYVKAEPAWAETLVNDGAYEYTVSSDCDGSNVTHWRRVPGLTYTGEASPWAAYTPEPAA